MKQRIQKILSGRGVASRRSAEQMIKAGRVMCNGAVCGLGDSADPDLDEILLDGKRLPLDEEKVYILLNKPRGFVTTLSDERGRKNVAQLVADCGKRVYPVGRLDMDSEGLLILTNDGEFANRLMHPSHQVDKVYRVNVKKFSQEALLKLKKPLVLDGYKIQPPKVVLMSIDEENPTLAQLEITIHEGRNRQVRRMCAAAGMAVARLTRVSEGCVQLGQLPSGKWRYLTQQEIAALMD